MIKIICDFCGENIVTKTNKGGKVKSFRLEENICEKCKKKNLNSEWELNKNKLNEEWSVIEKEKRKFVNSLLKCQKKDWEKQKKKEFFGTFFIEGE